MKGSTASNVQFDVVFVLQLVVLLLFVPWKSAGEAWSTIRYSPTHVFPNVFHRTSLNHVHVEHDSREHLRNVLGCGRVAVGWLLVAGG